MMKNQRFVVSFFLLMTFFWGYAQSYDQLWRTIENNEKAGKFKSNLPIVLKIEQKAKKEGNAKALILALKCEYAILRETEHSDKNNVSSNFFKKLTSIESQLTTKDRYLYEVLVAEFISDYYQRNRWKINRRTALNNPDVATIETWSKLDFKKYLSKKYDVFNAQTSTFKKIKLEPYEDLFRPKGVAYTPTLNDYYKLQYIDFLKNNGLFTHDELQANKAKITTTYQQLISDNRGNTKIYFQHQLLQFEKPKDELEQLKNIYASEKCDYQTLIATNIARKLKRDKNISAALMWLRKAKKDYPKSVFINDALNLENEILQRSLVVKFEREIQANKPIHFVATTKNVDDFSVEVYKIVHQKDLDKSVYNQFNKIEEIQKKLVRHYDFHIPHPKDYKEHRTALSLNQLPSGGYILKTQAKNIEKPNYRIIFVAEDQVVEVLDDSKENVFQLINRENGVFVPNRSLTIIDFTGKKLKTVTTDKKGVFKVPNAKQRYYRYYVVDHKTQATYAIRTNNRYYHPPYKEQKISQIFLDRGIYRPGQKVYFKTIVTQKKETKKSVVPHEKQTIALHNANGEKIQSQTFITNEYGSYHGHFLLPKGKLNGQFYLTIKNDKRKTYKYFKVEEYKRPKFEVIFEPIKDEYQLGETLRMKGKVISYSGTPLSDAQVDYEIKRKNVTWRYFPYYESNANFNSILGKLKTNDKGEFTIEVKLDKDEKREGIQVFNYHVEASVMDVSGEMQTAQQNIKVANVSHYITTKTKANFFSDEKVKIDVLLQNYNHQPLQRTYQVVLTQLDEGNRLIRENFKNNIQDFPMMTETEFHQKFPHDYYRKPKKNKGQIVLTKEKIKGKLDLGKLKAGNYQLHVFNVEGKDSISTKTNFTIWNPQKIAKNQKSFLQIIPQKETFNRNEKGKVYIYSAVPNALVHINFQDGLGNIQNTTIPLKKGVGIYTFDIPKNKDVKNVRVIARLTAYNDTHFKHLRIGIKDEDENLTVKTLTFRDKITPSSKEKWRVKITGKKHEKINAEVLANMYDMSLDQFEENTYHWAEFNRRYRFLSYQYQPRGLESRHLSSVIKRLGNHDVSVPDFSWVKNNDANILQSVEGTVAGVRIQSDIKPYSKRVYSDSITTKELNKVVLSTNDEKLEEEIDETPSIDKIKLRENFNETAFFYPSLYTDKKGEVSFEFTSPEALTKWKLMLLAHNKNERFGYLEKEVVTQKQFSITPNYPRFVREGDVLHFKTKISSLMNKQLAGEAYLKIIDPVTNEDISSEFNFNTSQKFNLKENGNTLTEWKITIPKTRSVMAIKIVAKAGGFSDGEQVAIPILPNRILVKEAIPILVKEGEKKTFGFDYLHHSKTLQSVSMSLELTTNPIWEVIFALPSLKYNTTSSADVVYNKWFADVLASEIMRTNPKIKTIFKAYQNKGELVSNLEKNQELKHVLLEQTPWVLSSKNETEQIGKIAKLFDVNTMSNELKTDWKKLQQLQNNDGGFSWYKGYKSSYATSIYILKSLGKLNTWLKGRTRYYQNEHQQKMTKKLVDYVDAEMIKYRKKNNTVWSNLTFDYLDARRYWENQYPLNTTAKNIKKKVMIASKKAKISDFTFFGLHRSALLFDAYGDKKLSTKLLTYLKETSTDTKNQGTYWKKNTNNWGWYQSKISNQSGAIEAFQTLRPQDTEFIEEMKMWLVTQKEANAWGTSKNTAEVIFTILQSGKSWTDQHKVNVVWRGEPIKDDVAGYLKKSIMSENIQPEKSKVTIEKNSAGIVQGGLFWSYFEELDQVQSTENDVSITKELYRKVKTENGERLEKITSATPLKIGDKLTVRMILNTDRDMQYIHVKDHRAAGLEPMSKRSGYQWKNGIGFYQNVKDTSVDFFIQYVPKGKYVFEYDYRCNASGIFSNGITTLQNYYAPQMNAHTKGGVVKIND